jgi:hypothetical protein
MDFYYKLHPIHEQRLTRKNREWRSHCNMERTELMEVSFYTDATPEFLHDVVFTGSDRIKLRLKQHEEPSVYSPLRLVLLEVYQVRRQYGSHKNASPLDVWEMVVMDGAFAMFKIVLNSRIQDVPIEHLHVGTTIFMDEKEFSIIRHKVAKDGNQRGLLFVTNFDYDPAPEHAVKPENIQNGDERSEVTPDFATAWISMDAIKRVKEESVFLFLDSFQHKEEGFFYWMPISGDRVIAGDFLISPDRQRTWTDCYHKRRWYESREPCKCTLDPHFMERCIVDVHPLESIDEEELFHEVRARLKGRVKASSFEELSPSHKRWCLYWYYAINLLHYGGGDAQPLPACLVDAIRKKHPDPNGSYTGFRTKEERLDAIADI